MFLVLGQDLLFLSSSCNKLGEATSDSFTDLVEFAHEVIGQRLVGNYIKKESGRPLIRY